MKAFLKRLKGVRRISMIQVEIYVFQAGEGDSFLVTVKDGKKEINLLIDCGNYVTYQKYIRKKLLNMAQNGKMIDYLILTHVHSDHIGGAIPLLKENGSSDAAKVIPIRNVLYNGFLGLKLQHYQEQACDDREKLIYQGICARRAAVLSKCIRGKRITLQEELCISKLLLDGRYNWNGGCGAWPEKVIINQSDQIEIGEHISIRFVSPGFNQLVAMNQEWEKYLERMNRRMDLKDNTLIRSAYESFQYILNEKHDFTTFINDTLVFGSTVLRHLSRYLILCQFRLFPRKWHKIPAGGSVHLAQTETPARFLSDICKTPHPDTVIVSWRSMRC